MPNTFVKARSRSNRLLRTTKRKTNGAAASLVVLGTGTAGARRALWFLQRMAELSQLGKVQSVVFYDCNELTVSYVQKFLRRFLGRSRHGHGMQVLFPSYVPMPNGFMRNPRRFEEYEGPLERDMDNIVGQVGAQSESSGRSPDVIIEFLGFSGHSVPSGRLHRKLRVAFPASVLLPVLTLPEDHASREWTRRYIWEQYESLLEGSNCLVTGLSLGSSGDDDIRLSTALAGFEAAEIEEEGAASSQLAAAYGRLVPSSGGWLGMATVRRKMPITRKFEWMRFPPWWQEYATVSSEEETSSSIADAIWSTLEPSSQMTPGLKEPYNAPQEVVVSLPVHPDALEPMAAETAEALERSNFFGQLPNTDIAFNTARFSEGLTKDPYMHVSRLYPILGELAPVMDILHPDRDAEQHTQALPHETGFGSYYHMDAFTSMRPLASAASVEPPDDDWEQNVRYI
ncbi:MAG: hypothetical protein F4Z05_15040 [Chloroflexi bacterium]|nr:hypothetical protein [Chloroflexota bacterium]